MAKDHAKETTITSSSMGGAVPASFAPKPFPGPSPAPSTAAADAALKRKVESLEQELELIRQKEGEITQERDFYFSKLREIELMCQTRGIKENWSVMQSVEAILYAATEDEATQAREEALKLYAPDSVPDADENE